jgi:ABC-type glycerol-3-phosphate transport system substrate-binding protein
MTEMARNDRRISQVGLAAFVLAAALLAGVLGGLVGARLTESTGSGAAQAAPAAAAKTTIDWTAYGAAWQRQYEAQHPTTLNPAMVQYGINWQRQYEAQHPQE